MLGLYLFTYYWIKIWECKENNNIFFTILGESWQKDPSSELNIRIGKVKGPYADHILIPQGSTGSSIFFDIKWKPIFFWLQIQNFSFKFFVVLEI